MAKRGRPRIHPPKIPKAEHAKVTIANQERQIKLLIDRCEELHGENDHLGRIIDSNEKHRAAMQEIFDKTCEDCNAKSIAYTRLLGWQDCARELFAGGANPFTASSTLGG